MQSGYDHYNRAPPDTGQPYPAHAQSDTLQFPDQFSLVYAGAVSDRVGAWLQLTYNGQSGSVGVDNIDIRYSDHTADNKWVWGITANNYVTFQDVWNGIGSYTIPNFNTVTLWSGGVAGAGTSGPIINALGPGVAAGVGAYVFYDDSLYFEFSEYHSAVPGGSSPVVDSVSLAANGGAIDRFAPYARIAYERDWGYHSAEIGASALYVNWIPSVGYISAQQQLAANEAAIAAGTPGTPPYTPAQTFWPGAINRYTDLSVDWQYQYNGQHKAKGCDCRGRGECRQGEGRWRRLRNGQERHCQRRSSACPGKRHYLKSTDPGIEAHRSRDDQGSELEGRTAERRLCRRTYSVLQCRRRSLGHDSSRACCGLGYRPLRRFFYTDQGALCDASAK